MDPFASERLTTLARCQNGDGGWGYSRARQSWLEPTCFAALALLRDEPKAARAAWDCISDWQNGDGGWRPHHEVTPSTWVTALAVSFGILIKQKTDIDTSKAVEAGVRWLVRTTGTETAWLHKAVSRAGLGNPERGWRWKGWPWTPGGVSGVEPTAHALAALRRAFVAGMVPADCQQVARSRISEGENLLLDLRNPDGGWDYGSRSGGTSSAQTTGVALYGLGAVPREKIKGAAERARILATESRQSIDLAWLSIALRTLNEPSQFTGGFDRMSDQVMDLALASLAGGSNADLLQTGGA
jgi:hypothetical protein